MPPASPNLEPARAGRVIPDPFSGTLRYRVIYADPPWTYRDQAHAGRRGVIYKYPLLTDADVERLPVERIAADDAALFLWVTWPKLPEVLPVIEAWGFRYRTVAFVWVKRTSTGKLTWGMGSWTRANTEPCLLATRGRPQRLDAGVHQVVEAPVQAHSRKPPEVRERIVRLLGDVPRIELFAREAPAGWDAWGNEAQVARAVSTAPERAPRPPRALKQHRMTPEELDRFRKWVLTHTHRQGRVTRADVMAGCGLAESAATLLLRRLVAEGELERHGRTKGTWYSPRADPGASRRTN